MCPNKDERESEAPKQHIEEDHPEGSHSSGSSETADASASEKNPFRVKTLKHERDRSGDHSGGS